MLKGKKEEFIRYFIRAKKGKIHSKIVLLLENSCLLSFAIEFNVEHELVLCTLEEQQ